MEPIETVGTGLAAAYMSKDVLQKLLGPTADYIGGEIAGLAKKCNVNLNAIFEKSLVKLGRRAEEQGHVSPRILKEVVTEGRFCEDALVAEYYAGILAGSRTQDQSDDRGLAILAVLKSLSIFQIRTHCAFYQTLRIALYGTRARLGMDDQDMRLFISFDSFCDAISIPRAKASWDILTHCIAGGVRSGIFGQGSTYGPPEFLRTKDGWSAPSDGLVIYPNVFGAEVFLWALGAAGASGHHILHPHYAPLECPLDGFEFYQTFYSREVGWKVS